MSDSKPPSTLSEISHLFLSSLRDRNPGPKRTPPPASKPSVSIDLTPEEFDRVTGTDQAQVSAPVSAVLTGHLDNAKAAVGAYAQHLAAHNQRVGIIEIDNGELRLSCLAAGNAEEPAAEAAAYFEPRHLAEAMEELNADVDRWLVVVKNPRLAEAQGVLKQISHWILISGCESDSIIAAYRSLKALSPLARPRLAVALLDAGTGDQSDRVYQKISSVCEQFLHWPIERGPVLCTGIEPNIHTIMHWNPPHDAGNAGPHWQVIQTFLSRARSADTEISLEEHQEISQHFPKPSAPTSVSPSQTVPSWPIPCGLAASAASAFPSTTTPILSLNATTPASVLDAILQHQQDLIACPVPLPMCETARLTVGRDRRLLLLAVAGKGLSDLRSIAYAYRWLTENRQLVAMAMPQLSIDATSQPKLRLLIDHADRDAQTLAPILQNPLVEMQPFRTLNWSGRLGLMLEAA